MALSSGHQHLATHLRFWSSSRPAEEAANAAAAAVVTTAAGNGGTEAGGVLTAPHPPIKRGATAGPPRPPSEPWGPGAGGGPTGHALAPAGARSSAAPERPE